MLCEKIAALNKWTKSSVCDQIICNFIAITKLHIHFATDNLWYFTRFYTTTTRGRCMSVSRARVCGITFYSAHPTQNKQFSENVEKKSGENSSGLKWLCMWNEQHFGQRWRTKPKRYTHTCDTFYTVYIHNVVEIVIRRLESLTKTATLNGGQSETQKRHTEIDAWRENDLIAHTQQWANCTRELDRWLCFYCTP